MTIFNVSRLQGVDESEVMPARSSEMRTRESKKKKKGFIQRKEIVGVGNE